MPLSTLLLGPGIPQTWGSLTGELTRGLQMSSVSATNAGITSMLQNSQPFFFLNMDTRDLNLSHHACVSDTLLSGPYPQCRFFEYFQSMCYVYSHITLFDSLLFLYYYSVIPMSFSNLYDTTSLLCQCLNISIPCYSYYIIFILCYFCECFSTTLFQDACDYVHS